VIYELTTCDFKPRTLPAVEALFAAAYDARRRHSELLGMFRTDIGPLNQLVQLWKYTSLAERERVAAAVTAEGSWPPAISEHLVGMRTAILNPVAYVPELMPGKPGPYYELRTYAIPLGGLTRMMSAWERAMPLRSVLGCPVAGIWSTEIGELNRLYHLWPYPSLEAREAIRRQVRVGGLWPPYLLDRAEGGGGYETISQENKIMLPLAFSPLQ
jgi:hypothetical protein